MVTSRKQRSETQASFWSKNVLPTPDMYFIAQSTKFRGGPTSAAQFIDTHFHVTSRNQGSFSKQERESWERDLAKTSG